MAIPIMGNGITVKSQVKVSINGMMEEDMMENGKIIRSLEKEK